MQPDNLATPFYPDCACGCQLTFISRLVVDTGDLHDGAGLSDATSPNGVKSNPIFENVHYDLLTIGNHELYLSDIAYLTANQFAKYYGERYISSNVQIRNNATGQYENIANQYRYFTTKKGIRIMAFGVLYDFTGNSNASKVIPARTMITQPWFKAALNYTQPIDLFLLIGHNSIRKSGTTIPTVYNAIRSARPDVPIQVFGGHTHSRDFKVYDNGGTGLESGRYCETLGFLSMSGIKAPLYKGAKQPKGVPNPTQPPRPINGSISTNSSSGTNSTRTNSTAFADLKYARRYLDWNRRTFAYHAKGSQDSTFDTPKGRTISNEVYELRQQLNLTALYGCAPRTWCLSCAPFGADGNIFTGILTTALAATVVNPSRAATPRIILLNTGSVRFDLAKGPFTYDDAFIVSPFHDTFEYIPDVPYAQAQKALAALNRGAFAKRDVEPRDLAPRDFGFTQTTGDGCVDATTQIHAHNVLKRAEPMTRGLRRRQTDARTPGYVTTDDFGADGDDTVHGKIPYYPQPEYFQANGSLPADGGAPAAVDVVFLDFIATDVVTALKGAGATYTAADVRQYLPPSFDTNSYLPAYAKLAWQANVPNCPAGEDIGP